LVRQSRPSARRNATTRPDSAST